MRAAWFLLALSAALVLWLIVPFFDPTGMSQGLRLLLLALVFALLIGAWNFLYTFAPTRGDA